MHSNLLYYLLDNKANNFIVIEKNVEKKFQSKNYYKKSSFKHLLKL